MVISIILAGFTILMLSGCTQPENPPSDITALHTDINQCRADLDQHQIMLEQYERFFTIREKGDAKMQEQGAYAAIAEEHYNAASVAYDISAFDVVITECEEARTNYFTAQELARGAKVFYEESQKSAPTDFYNSIGGYYIQVADAQVNITSNLYEACEYFETASRMYDVEDWEGGGAAIESMNEKIESHDRWINVYNEAITKIRVLIETA